MIYNIFRNNILVVQVKPDSTSELSQKRESEDVIRLNFTLNTLADIRIGDYIVFEKTGQIYTLNKLPRVIERPKNYKYECIFEGKIHELRKTKIFLTTIKTTGSYKDYRFPLTGNAKTFLDFIISNLNAKGGSYVAGVYKETNTITVDFNNWNAFEAITEISKQLGFSWYLEGNTLNFDSKEPNAAYSFQIGRFLGLTELLRLRVENEEIETAVYGYGSTKNLPPRTAETGQTYDSDLLTENRLCFDGVNGESLLEKNIDKYGRIESIQEFDIFPERTGTVSSVNSDDLRIFFDDAIDFDIEQQKLSGITPKIKFLSGSCLGLTFNIAFDYSLKKFTVDFYTDESGQYPNDTIRIQPGDTYTIFDIIMPASYISDAKTRLQEATQNYLNNSSQLKELYEGNPDPYVIEKNNIQLYIGDWIRIISATFKIDKIYEINELVQNLNDPHNYTIKFGNVIPRSLLTLLKQNNFAVQQQISNVSNVFNTTNIGQELQWQNL